MERESVDFGKTKNKDDILKNFYLIDFIKSLAKSNNVPVLLYLGLNIFLIGMIVTILFGIPFWQGFFEGIVLYVISISIALSPIGELVLRLQTGCRKIKNERQKERLMPLFQEVYERARKKDPTIPNGIRLFINHDESMNAFATGRKTICVTEGLLSLSDEQIKATLSHEFGHLAHKDTDLILVVSVGNLIITTIVTVVRLVINLMQLFFGIVCIFVGGSEGAIASVLNVIYNILINVFVDFVMWIWTKIGILMVMKSSRANEYLADRFAFNLGYGDELCLLLAQISGPEPKGLFKSLVSSHPKTQKRIEKLQEMSRVSYSA